MYEAIIRRKNGVADNRPNRTHCLLTLYAPSHTKLSRWSHSPPALGLDEWMSWLLMSGIRCSQSSEVSIYFPSLLTRSVKLRTPRAGRFCAWRYVWHRGSRWFFFNHIMMKVLTNGKDVFNYLLSNLSDLDLLKVVSLATHGAPFVVASTNWLSQLFIDHWRVIGLCAGDY